MLTAGRQFQVLGDQRRLPLAGGVSPERIIMKREVPGRYFR
jgi:hypothetical protein